MRAPRKYSDRQILESALKFQSRWKWQQGEGWMYKAARARGILDACCAHMPKRVPKPQNNPLNLEEEK